MQEDQSGSEGQRPEYVGPWSPSGREADTSAETGAERSRSPDAEPGQPGETAPLILPPGASPAGQQGDYTRPEGYGPAGQYGPSGDSGPGGYGPSGDYPQYRGFGQAGSYGQSGGS